MPFLIPAGLAIAGAVGKGKAANRDANNAALAEQQSRDLQAAAFNRSAPGARQSAAARGDLMANVQPAAFTGSGRDLRLTGGINPNVLSAGSRQLGQDVSRQALLSQLGQAGANDPYANFDTGKYAPKKAGFLDKLLLGAGIAGSGLDLMAPKGPLGGYTKGLIK